MKWLMARWRCFKYGHTWRFNWITDLPQYHCLFCGKKLKWITTKK